MLIRKKIIYFLLFLVFSLIFLTSTNATDDSSPVLSNTIKLYSEIKPPTLSIRIPQLTFSQIKDLITQEDDGVYLHIPWIGQYLRAVYNFSLGVVSIVAVVMLILQGLTIIASGGGERKTAAYKKILQILIGLTIVWGSYAILYNINPSLVQFKSFKVKVIEEIDLTQLTYLWNAEMDSSNESIEIISDPNFHHSTPGKVKTLTDQDIKNLATKNKLDPCILWAAVKKESGGQVLAIGHDENYPINKRGDKCVKIPGRRKFLTDGLTYKNVKFTPPATFDSYDPCTMNSTKQLNDDGAKVLNISEQKPPDYGLDWRYPHGIGIGQITIFPGKDYSKKINGPNGPEWARNVGGKWFTVTDLFNVDKSAEATISLIKTLIKKSGGDMDKFWSYYGGSKAGILRATQKYKACTIK